MLATHKKWTKKGLKDEVKQRKLEGNVLPASSVLLETSFFGPEIKQGEVCACLDHPRRSTFATVTIDKDLNIVGVK